MYSMRTEILFVILNTNTIVSTSCFFEFILFFLFFPLSFFFSCGILNLFYKETKYINSEPEKILSLFPSDLKQKSGIWLTNGPIQFSSL